jgi:acyl carrier protein
MDHGEVAGRLESYVRRQFAVSPRDARFGRAAALFDLGYVDSVGVVELLSFVRESFGFDIPDDDLLSDDFSTLDGIARIVCRLAGAGPAPPAPAPDVPVAAAEGAVLQR